MKSHVRFLTHTVLVCDSISAVIVPVGRRLRISFSSETGYNYETRHKSSLESYQLLVKWAKKGYGYVEELVVPRAVEQHHRLRQAQRRPQHLKR